MKKVTLAAAIFGLSTLGSAGVNAEEISSAARTVSLVSNQTAYHGTATSLPASNQAYKWDQDSNASGATTQTQWAATNSQPSGFKWEQTTPTDTTTAEAYADRNGFKWSSSSTSNIKVYWWRAR